jgi:hypothetical protein
MNYWAVGQNPFWSTNAMQITVVAVMCHTLGAFFPEAVGTRPDPACREVIVVKDEMPMQFCMLFQPAPADWKERSIYRGDQWRISRIKCVPGDYVPKERV